MNPGSMKPRVLTVLGATGTIGVNTLDVVARHPGRFEIFAPTGATQVDPWGKAIQEVYRNLRAMLEAYWFIAYSTSESVGSTATVAPSPPLTSVSPMHGAPSAVRLSRPLIA